MNRSAKMDLPAWGLIFSAPMVIEILGDRKTMTRRLDKRLLSVKKGRLLYVKETWTQPFKRTKWNPGVIYLADGPDYNSCASAKHQWHKEMKGVWKPSIFMPRWAARTYLVATADARLEKLTDITLEDLKKEGMPDEKPRCSGPTGPDIVESFKRLCFIDLWEKLHGKDSWDLNPDVVVLEFLRMTNGAAK